MLQVAPAAELEPALPNTQGESTATVGVVPGKPATQVTEQKSLIKAPPAALLQSSRFPQHSVNPGRGSQCPYTKDGTLARHRLTPMATGTITGPFGTVEVSTNELDTEELMQRVNQAFFGSKDGSGDQIEPPKKRQKADEQKDSNKRSLVKIKTEQNVEDSEEQTVYLSDAVEISTIPNVNNSKIESNTPTVKANVSKPTTYKQTKTLYKCTQCDLEFPFGPKLKRHEEEHKMNQVKPSSGNELRCPDCKKGFATERALNFHTRLNCTPLHGCNYCDQKFHFRYQLDEHYLADHKEEAETLFPNELQCSFCGDSYRTEALLNHHKGRSHRGWKKTEKDQPVSCEVCNESFKKASELKHHVKLQHTPTECEFCKEECENQNAYIDHLYECAQAPPGEAEKRMKTVSKCIKSMF